MTGFDVQGIAYCGVCEQDTMPSNGTCLWCNTRIATGELDVHAAAQEERQRQKARSASNSAAYRSRKRPPSHQVAR